MKKKVVIIATGVANTASMAAALRRAGAEVVIEADQEEISSAPYVVLPGVGSFECGMQMLERSGLCQVLKDRVSSGRPTLAVCLGMQLLARSSEESAGVAGLGVVREEVRRFRGEVRVPQLGWNELVPETACRYLTRGFAYFANSYCLHRVPGRCPVAVSVHGEPFIAAFESAGLLACQFHPELSGAWGAALIRRWLEEAEQNA